MKIFKILTIMFLIFFGSQCNLSAMRNRVPINEELFDAARNGRVDVVQLLLDRGINPNQQNDDGDTPLMLALENSHEDVGLLFLNRGADFDDKAALYCFWQVITSWYLNNNPYSMSFSSLLESEEFADTDLPHDLKAHKTILIMRLEEWTTTKLKETLALMSKREAKAFLFWIYTGITQDGQTEQIVQTCRDLNIDYLAKSDSVGFRNDMQRLYDRKEYTYNKEAGDFTIVLGKRKIVEYKAIPAQTIQVHKTILAARSNMFRDMFLNTTDTSDKVRDRSGLSLPAFNAIIEFIYTGQISNLTQEISNELLEEMAALFFQLPEGELEEYLERFFQE